MYWEYSPPELANLVDAIWFTDSSVDPKVGHLVKPTVSGELIVKLFAGHSEIVFSGPMTSQRQYPYVAEAAYFGIRWSASAGASLKTFSLADLRNRSIELNRELAFDFSILAEQLHKLEDRSEQVTLFTDVVVQQLGGREWDPHPDLLHALWLGEQLAGDISVSQLASNVSISRRQLERLFLRHSGLTPKQYCRILRLQHLATCLEENPAIPLAQVALHCGYSDQAHMAREYKTMMGSTIRQRP